MQYIYEGSRRKNENLQKYPVIRLPVSTCQVTFPGITAYSPNGK